MSIVPQTAGMNFCVESGLKKGSWQKYFFRYGDFFGEEMVGNFVKGSKSVFRGEKFNIVQAITVS